MISERKMKRALARDRAYRECRADGTHPTPSNDFEERTLGGHVVLMERCAVCGILTAPIEDVER